MKYIAADDLSRVVTVLLADLHTIGAFSEVEDLLDLGVLDTLQENISQALDNNDEIVEHLITDADDISKLRESYKALLELNRVREKEIEQQKILLDGLETLLWENLEDFNRLRASYTIDQIRDIFKDNLGTPKLCEECGKMFVATSHKQKFCTVECRKKAAGKRRHD